MSTRPTLLEGKITWQRTWKYNYISRRTEKLGMVTQSTDLFNAPETAMQWGPNTNSMFCPWPLMWTQAQPSFGSGWMRLHHQSWPERISCITHMPQKCHVTQFE